MLLGSMRTALARWKLWGVLTILVLAAAHILGEFPVIQVLGDYSLLGMALSYAGFVLFWLFIVSFLYAWWSGRIKFPRFLTKKVVITAIPIIIVGYMHLSLFLYEEFIAFQMFSFPLVIIDFPLLFLYLYATAPFEPLLDPIGLWASGGLFLIGGPTLLGSFLIAGVYSLALYFLWSVLAVIFRRRRAEF